jgi:hypothetical protein
MIVVQVIMHVLSVVIRIIRVVIVMIVAMDSIVLGYVIVGIHGQLIYNNLSSSLINILMRI